MVFSAREATERRPSRWKSSPRPCQITSGRGADSVVLGWWRGMALERKGIARSARVRIVVVLFLMDVVC